MVCVPAGESRSAPVALLEAAWALLRVGHTQEQACAVGQGHSCTTAGHGTGAGLCRGAGTTAVLQHGNMVWKQVCAVGQGHDCTTAGDMVREQVCAMGWGPRLCYSRGI